jgi:ATP-dependent Clp protease protease subunit
MDITQPQEINKEIKMKEFHITDFINSFKEKNESFKKFEDVVGTVSQIKREVYFDDVNPDVSSNVELLIRFWNMYDDERNIPVEEREPIKLYIDSWGGWLVSAFTIINAIELSKTPVWTINVGAAYSAGFFIFIAGHKRFAYPLSSFLFHEGSTGGGEGMDAHKFRNHADFYSKQIQQLKEHTLKYTKITEEDYKKIEKDDYWLTAQEALAQGVCDEIVKEFVSWDK